PFGQTRYVAFEGMVYSKIFRVADVANFIFQKDRNLNLLAEQINDRKVFSLLEVTRSIQKTLMERYTSSFWVKAEMNKLNFYRQSGHAYPELVEKKEGKIIAEIRANLWRDDYRRINLLFQEVLHEPLKDGIKVLMLAKVGYDPVYGLSLTILDI